MNLKNTFLVSKFLQISKFISLWGVDEDTNQFEKNFTVLINQYLALLSLIFLLHSISIIIFIKITMDSVFLGLVSLYYILSMLLKEKRKNKNLLAAGFIFLCVVITYYSSYCGQKSGVYLFYFPLILGLAFFFDVSKDKWLVLFIICFILICIYTTIIFDFHLVELDPLTITHRYEKTLMLLNVTFSVLAFVLDYYFIEQKKSFVDVLQSKNETNIATIDLLVTENDKLMKTQIIARNLTEENIDEIIKLAQTNDPFFLDLFQFYFPYFLYKLDEISSKLILSDQHLCALMRLNLDTKQIATFTNTTIKSVESKKYRLRKKLNIPSNTEITQWMLSI